MLQPKATTQPQTQSSPPHRFCCSTSSSILSTTCLTTKKLEVNCSIWMRNATIHRLNMEYVCVCVCVCIPYLYNKERAVQENFINHLSLSNILLEVYMSCMRCAIKTIKPIDPGGSCWLLKFAIYPNTRENLGRWLVSPALKIHRDNSNIVTWQCDP